MRIQVRDLKVGTLVQKDGITYKIICFSNGLMKRPLRVISCRGIEDPKQYFEWYQRYDDYVNIEDGNGVGFIDFDLIDIKEPVSAS